MRSMRRGIKEMDLILTAFARDHLEGMDDATLDAYESMMNENDQDLLSWVIGQAPVPKEHSEIIAQVTSTLPLN